MRNCRVLTSIVLSVSLVLLLMANTVLAADSGIEVGLPTQTNRLTLTVSGKAPAGSAVESPQAAYSTTADAKGRFWITLTLREGKNTVTVTAKSPDHDPLTWTGETNVDLKAPALTVDLPRSVGIGDFTLIGQAAPGAKVEVNGEAVTPDAMGRFSSKVYIDPGGTFIQVKATDAAGKVTEVIGYVAERIDGSHFSTDPVKRLSFQAPVGSHVDLYYSTSPDGDRKKVDEPKLNAEGTWNGAIEVSLNWNYYWFVVTPPAGEPYSELYQIFRPFDVLMVSRTNLETLNIPGEVAPGYRVSINGIEATMQEPGQFVGALTLKLGEQRVTIEASSETGYIRRGSTTYQVTRVPDLAPLYQPVLTLEHQSRIDIFLVGNKTYRADRTGTVTIPLELKKGSNLVVLPVISGFGQARVHLYRVDYIPSTVVRLTMDKETAEVDGVATPVSVAPTIRDSSAYLPLRFLGEVLGAKVEWDQETRTATYTRGTREIKLTVGERVAVVNGEVVELTAPVVLQNDRTLVPVRFISENLGAKVTWDDRTRTVTVIMPKD